MTISIRRVIIIYVLVVLLTAERKVHKHHNHHVKHITQEETQDIKLIVIREGIAVIGLLLCLVGSRIIKVSMFICGFLTVFVAVYLTLPSIVDNETCCGPKGNWIIRVSVCIVMGLLGGALTLFVYYVGIFAIGGILGMIAALLALSTPLAEKEFFDTAFGVGIFYGGLIVLGGLLALVLKKIAVALGTSVGGSYAVFYGVDYFAKTNFSSGIHMLIIQIQEHIEDEFGLRTHQKHHHPLFREYNVKDALIFTFFVLLAVLGFSFQMYLDKSDEKLKKIKCCKECQCDKAKSTDQILQYLKTMQMNSSNNLIDPLAKERLLDK